MNAPAVDLDAISRILIVKPTSLGDIIQTYPALEALRRRFPAARIGWVVADDYVELLKAQPKVDDLLVYERRKWRTPLRMLRDLPAFADFLRAVQEYRADLALDFQGLARSGLITFRSGARYAVGFAAARELGHLAYSHRIRLPADVLHAVDRYRYLLQAIGIPADSGTADIPVTDAARAVWSAHLQTLGGKPGGYGILMPLTRWRSKNWPVAHFIALGRLLLAKGLPQVLILGTAGEADTANVIAAEIGGGARSLAGQLDTLQLVEAVRHARFVVAGDSGPIHIAASLSVPTIGVYGPTDPLKAGPYGQLENALHVSLDCIKCYEKVCPMTGAAYLRCLNDLTPEMIFARCQSYL